MIEFIRRRQGWFFAVILLGGLWAGWQRWRSYREGSQDIPILAAARQYGVDPALIKAVVWRESGFNPRARGRAGEIGLMQMTEVAAQEWAEAERVPLFLHQQLFDPGKNTLAGTWYLRKMMRRYAATDNPVAYALSDYNAGRGNVLRWNKGAASTNSAVFLAQMNFPGTREYVRSILNRYAKYQRVFPPKEKRS